jgi:hypothetical protein
MFTGTHQPGQLAGLLGGSAHKRANLRGAAGTGVAPRESFRIRRFKRAEA